MPETFFSTSFRLAAPCSAIRSWVTTVFRLQHVLRLLLHAAQARGLPCSPARARLGADDFTGARVLAASLLSVSRLGRLGGVGQRRAPVYHKHAGSQTIRAFGVTYARVGVSRVFSCLIPHSRYVVKTGVPARRANSALARDVQSRRLADELGGYFGLGDKTDLRPRHLPWAAAMARATASWQRASRSARKCSSTSGLVWVAAAKRARQIVFAPPADRSRTARPGR